jgi:Reverse transcriptase (RNA-dependent DNA polymerase)
MATHSISSSHSKLSPDMSSSFDTPSDHYPIFTRLNILPTPRPDPTSHSFRRISSINTESFMQDLSLSDLILNTPSTLDNLLSSYNTTLSTLLDKHAPLITKSGSHSKNPWYTSYLQSLKSFRRRLERNYKRTRDPQLLSALKSATNKYHNLLASAKKRFYSSLVHSRSSHPRLLWKTINQLLHRNSSSPLPNSLPSSSIAESFCSFFSGKISTLRLSLQSLLPNTTTHSPADASSSNYDSPLSPPRSSLSIFEPASESEVSHLLHSLPNKQCELDPIPTSLLKDCASILVPIITKIINISLSTGNFPLLFKHSLVTPLLKKPSLDKETLNNYRPVSNLSFISKLTERIVLSRINDYLTSNSLLNPYQSGFTKRHSTETLLTSLYNKLVSAISHQQISCLCLLDISAAFDTIDHNILLQRLSTWFGFTDTALLWIQSYLTSRSFSVKTAETSSQPCPLTCGVPQGSVLGPLLFILYTTPLSSLIKASSVDHHLYADDTQLFISFSPSSFSDSINHLVHVVTQISSWMTSNLLCLNPSKTEFILIGLRNQLEKIPDPSISLNLDSATTHTFTANTPARNLGVIFDQNLTFSDHITQLSRTCFMHIRDLRRIRPLLDYKTASTIATSIVHTKLDYCNSLFLNIDKAQIKRLQAIQNALARAVTRTPKHFHITPVLESLHWLKIPERIQYKVLSLTYNTLQSSQPCYLRQLFTIQPLRSTRSSSALTLLRPQVTSSLKFSNRSIAIAVPPIWNKLPPELRQISDPSYGLTRTSPLAVSSQVFHSKLKTLLFHQSYPDSSSSPHLPHRLNCKHHPP